jgi:glyoxylase-like metal-dependent hydrolase (beta-lactamase superfamily II)
MKQVMGRVGAVEVGRVHELTFLGQTAADFYPLFDRELVRNHEQWLCPAHFDRESLRIPMDVQSFVLTTERHTIVIDTCCGNGKSRAGAPEFHMLTTGYLERMRTLGVEPEDVDYVLCTHLHIDHIGWNTRLVNGRWTPTFPNARYVVSKDEFKNATEEARTIPFEPVRNGYKDSIAPVFEAGLVDLVQDDYELLDMLRFRPAPGHTPGNVQIELHSNSESAIFAGDMLHTPMQIPFWHWSSKLCWNAEVAAKTRRRLLEQCTEANALLVPGHFGSPHVGRIREAGETFKIIWGW